MIGRQDDILHTGHQFFDISIFALTFGVELDPAEHDLSRVHLPRKGRKVKRVDSFALQVLPLGLDLAGTGAVDEVALSSKVDQAWV